MALTRSTFRSHSRAGRLGGVVALVGVLTATIAACESPGEPATPAASASQTPSASSSTETEPASDAVEVPDTAVGREVRWVLGALDPATPVTAEHAAGRLSAAALESISGEQLVGVFGQLAASGPWHPTSYDGTETAALSQIESATGDRLELSVSLGADGLIEGLLFQPPYDHTAATSWEELSAAVGALPAETALVVVDVSDPAAPETVYGIGGTDTLAPIGSVVKLYVLGAVVEAVAAGELRWDDTVTVTDELRSLPSGQLQDAPAGTEVTVREAAQAMIEISDNTATDLLIDAVGREAVENQLTAMGHADPSVNIPLITTRELFWLGWGDGGAYTERWRDGDEAARRALLEELPAGPPEVPAVLGDVVWDDGVDWFATPVDLVAAHVALAGLAETPAGEPLREILGANPGLTPTDVAAFDTVAFKGGSSAGEMALTWRVATPDQAWVVVLQASALNINDVADVRRYAAVAGDAVALGSTQLRATQ